ncbi:MAG: hypothetical protein KJP08_00775 [Gammaproteobacteria bacterium]|nr:hypothetical protein [Gammaproteobacteria bacterium]MBT8093315.1 hypothetical protein [Gammaproteobacteria bacterium]NNL63489.1 hypothetical protein [Woeseiaceae bacterium]
MDDFNELIEELKQKRDELRVQMNLASKELRDEWDELEEKTEDFMGKVKSFTDEADIKETGEGIGEALGQVGSEIKKGYERLWKAIKD